MDKCLYILSGVLKLEFFIFGFVFGGCGCVFEKYYVDLHLTYEVFNVLVI